MKCNCFQIGGPYIAEDPDCPIHGTNSKTEETSAKKIEIEWLTDEHECEVCGSSYAEGAIVKLDGNVILELEPVAHCYNGTDYTRTDIYVKIFEHLGYVIGDI